eukprot:COSAG05_NODE_1692_length_4267_cov_7.040770_1_plen_79_part_00
MLSFALFAYLATMATAQAPVDTKCESGLGALSPQLNSICCREKEVSSPPCALMSWRRVVVPAVLGADYVLRPSLFVLI